MEASNFKATSAGGQAVNTEVRTVDNITSNVITLYPRGSFTSFQLYNNCSSWAAPDGTASAGEFLTSGKRQYSTGYIYYQGDVLLTNWNFLYKFDDTVFEPTGEDIGVGHGYTSVNVKAETSTCLYAAKPDKTGWKSDEEQTKAKEEDLIYFKSYKELKDAGYTCVGFLEEVRKGKYSEVYLRFGLKVRDDAKPGSVGMTTHCTKGWTGKDKVGSWTEHLYKDNQNIYGTGDGSTANGKIYRNPNYSVHSKYAKAVYEDGTIVKGHTNGHIAGQSLLITGDQTQISISTANGKEFYDVDNGERVATFKLTPSLKITSANSSTTDSGQYDNVYITTTLPKDLHYNVGTASKEPDSVKENTDGTTTIKWTLKNQKVGGAIDPITFDCKIGAAGTKNDVENNQQIQAQAKISSDQDKRKCTTDYGNLSKTTINIIKLATSSIAKTVDKELNEVGAPFKFTLNMGNTSEIDVKQARLYLSLIHI